ncbi:hypothetical protein SAY87_012383 [Trapa incisa]|uniref:Uncharacterized protein n=1 Tax=Trapa incisa TaxID=236973 RepID=A0AAN7GKU5_9MYRT|nr:hypothetical protein SAY87_012383 [Trapa incisa]
MGLNIRNAAMGMAKRVAVTPLRALYNLCFFFLAVILARVGLLRVRPLGRREGETLEEPPTPNDLYVLVMDGGAPSLVHVRVLTSLFKNRVPVVEFGEELRYPPPSTVSLTTIPFRRRRERDYRRTKMRGAS